MDYKKIYDSIISERKLNPLSEELYTENHHILPRCMGGDDSKENLVRLTPEEHFFVHKLLCKIYPEVSGLRFALIMMTWGEKRSNNKLYGIFKRMHANAVGAATRLRWLDNEYREYMISCVCNRPKSEETRKRISESINEYYKSDRYDPTEISESMKEKHRNGFFNESYKKISEANKGRPKPSDFGEKIRKARIGMKFTEEHKDNIRKNRKGHALGERNSMSKAENRQKVSDSKIGRRKVISFDGSFRYIKKEFLDEYRYEDGKYYDY